MDSGLSQLGKQQVRAVVYAARRLSTESARVEAG